MNVQQKRLTSICVALLEAVVKLIREINPSGSQQPNLDEETLKGEEICQCKVFYCIEFFCGFAILTK